MRDLDGMPAVPCVILMGCLLTAVSHCHGGHTDCRKAGSVFKHVQVPEALYMQNSNGSDALTVSRRDV